MYGISTQPVISRHDHLAIASKVVIIAAALTAQAENRLLAGVVLGKVAGGKYRPYAEADLSSATSASPTLDCDPSGKLFKYFMVGDVVEGVGAEALGTIVSIDSITGTITLSANATTAGYSGAIRVRAADLSVANGDFRILKHEVQHDERIGVDEVAAGYFEGVFLKSALNLTASLTTALGAREIESNEVRIK